MLAITTETLKCFTSLMNKLTRKDVFVFLKSACKIMHKYDIELDVFVCINKRS